MIIIKYRIKPPIIQAQLDDFIGTRALEVYESWVPRDYRIIRKKFNRWLPVRTYQRKTKTTNGGNANCLKTLDSFLSSVTPPTLPKPQYLLRFRSIRRCVKEDHADGLIPDYDWIMARSLTTFAGFFNHLFELNDFSMLDNIQAGLEDSGVSFKNISIIDVFRFELLRLQLGFHDYTGLEKVFYFAGWNTFAFIQRDFAFFPAAADISNVMTRIPPCKLYAFYLELVREAIDLKIIVPRVLLWDTQFVHSNSNNNKNKRTNAYNDPDAGYGRHNGRKLGVGYSVSSLYAYCGSWNRNFPVHFDVFPANKSDNPIFRETLSNYLSQGVGECKVIVADTGAYSKRNLNFCMDNGIYPVIRAKKNLVTHPIVEVKRGYWFNTDYFPPGWSAADIRYIYERRPAIEAGQSANNTFYNAGRMHTRGIDNAIRGRAMIYILDLLRALTAVKLGRPDLISKLTAFSTSRDIYSPDNWADKARASGYDLLLPSKLETRQKENRDKWVREREQRKMSKEKLK
nr:transposase [Candidatus Sigynarchaeota archaeon]